MAMNFVRLACCFGMGLGLAACATPRAHERGAPAASAISRNESKGAPAEEGAEPGTPTAAPAPAPQGLDQPKSKADRDDDEFSTLEAAERALNQAKADLDRLALAEPAPVVGRSAAADRAAEKKESRATKAPSAAGAAAPSNANGLCESACRAFSSLSRAANAVCRLDGDSGAHCTRAKRVVADSQQRVASCSCPASSD